MGVLGDREPAREDTLQPLFLAPSRAPEGPGARKRGGKREGGGYLVVWIP